MWNAFKKWLKRKLYGNLYVITYYDENGKIVGQRFVRSKYWHDVRDNAMFNLMNIKKSITCTIEMVDE